MGPPRGLQHHRDILERRERDFICEVTRTLLEQRAPVFLRTETRHLAAHHVLTSLPCLRFGERGQYEKMFNFKFLQL